jgi:inorganic pyrophosphatase
MKRWWLDVRMGRSSQCFLLFFFRMRVVSDRFVNSVMSFVGHEYGIEKNTLEEDVDEGDVDEHSDG